MYIWHSNTHPDRGIEMEKGVWKIIVNQYYFWQSFYILTYIVYLVYKLDNKHFESVADFENDTILLDLHIKNVMKNIFFVNIFPIPWIWRIFKAMNRSS